MDVHGCSPKPDTAINGFSFKQDTARNGCSPDQTLLSMDLSLNKSLVSIVVVVVVVVVVVAVFSLAQPTEERCVLWKAG